LSYGVVLLGRLAAVGGALRLWLEVGGKGIRKAEKIKAKIIAHRAERMEKVKDRGWKGIITKFDYDWVI
jgi:hypothetical protein